MDKLTSILIVANRTPSDRALLAKAVLLARSVGARIHLFYCDAELAYSLRHSYDQQDNEKARLAGVSEHRRYLNELRAAAQAPTLDISLDAACDSPLYEGIIKQVLTILPDLVMKSASGAHPLRRFTFDSNDWQLMRTCPVTLMLVRAETWRACPQFAALVDVSDQETPHLAEAIIHTSAYFTLGCRGELDVVYSERQQAGAECNQRLSVLERLVQEYRIGAGHVHVLSGDPDVTLPEFAAKQRYDALVMGALTHRKGIAALVGTLTGRLVDALDCDFILVKRAPRDQVRQEEASLEVDGPASAPLPRLSVSTNEKRAGSRLGALWQALFGD